MSYLIHILSLYCRRVFTTVIVLLEEKSAHQRGFLNDLLKLKKKQKRKEILL